MPSRHGHDTRYSRRTSNDGRSALDDGKFAANPRKLMKDIRKGHKESLRMLARAEARDRRNSGGRRTRRNRRTRRHH